MPLAVASPELYIEGITTVYADVDYHARRVAKLLQLARSGNPDARTDIPIYNGLSATLLRNRNGLLPLDKETKVLLLNDVHTTQRWVNNYECHAATFWNKMLEQAPNVYCVEYTQLDEESRERIERRIPEADVIVATTTCTGASQSGKAPA